MQAGGRYFAKVNNPQEYTKGWSGWISIHDRGVKESPTIFTHAIKVVDKNGKLDPIGTTVINAAASFNFVLKYYPSDDMAVTSNTASLPHVITTPGYVFGTDANVNVRWAEIFMREAPKCKPQ